MPKGITGANAIGHMISKEVKHPDQHTHEGAAYRGERPELPRGSVSFGSVNPAQFGTMCVPLILYP